MAGHADGTDQAAVEAQYTAEAILQGRIHIQAWLEYLRLLREAYAIGDSGSTLAIARKSDQMADQATERWIFATRGLTYRKWTLTGCEIGDQVYLNNELDFIGGR
jgi:hypothetical protein